MSQGQGVGEMTQQQLVDSLVQALESQLDAVSYYYDLTARQVVVINDELGEVPDDFDSSSGRFLIITPLSNNERYEIMEAFIELRPDEGLQEDLNRALIERGAFISFEKALEKYPSQRVEWKRFWEERVRVKALAWLVERGDYA